MVTLPFPPESEHAQHGRSAEEMTRELAEFVYIVSHDLNAPIRHMREFTRLLLNRLGDKIGPEEQQLAKVIDQAMHQSEGMLASLLEYSRINTRAQPFARVNCGTVIERALYSLDRMITEHHANINVGPLPIVWGDEGQLTQLFHHLLENAIKFHNPDKAPWIDVSATLENGMWQFTVRDDGIGIAPEYCERVFILFKRFYTEGDYPGMGAGLSIARKIVERHGGKIWCASAPGQGTELSFTLPGVRGAKGELLGAP